MSIVQATFDVSKTEVTFGKKRYKVPMYGCHQQGNRHMTDSRDVLMTLTKTETWFFWTMDKAKDIETNEVFLSRNCCPDQQVSYFTKVMASLVSKNIIIRLKQNNYLINPNMTLPLFENYDKILAKWESLGGKPLTK